MIPEVVWHKEVIRKCAFILQNISLILQILDDSLRFIVLKQHIQPSVKTGCNLN